MENFVRVLVGALTLGISEIMRIAQENKKCAYEYIYTKKGKTSCCKYRKRCALWPRCMETNESCRQVHLEWEKAGGTCEQDI